MESRDLAENYCEKSDVVVLGWAWGGHCRGGHCGGGCLIQAPLQLSQTFVVTQGTSPVADCSQFSACDKSLKPGFVPALCHLVLILIAAKAN